MNADPFRGLENLLSVMMGLSAILSLFGAAYAVLSTYAIFLNLRDNRGIDRLTWLFVICMPFGFIFFWLFRNQPPGPNYLPPADPDYTPPPQTPNDIAAAIAADLAKEKRDRKQHPPVS